jgi:hypothetical protein
MTAKDTHATLVEVFEAVFSVRSVPRLYNEKVLRRQLEEQEVAVRWPEGTSTGEDTAD